MKDLLAIAANAVEAQKQCESGKPRFIVEATEFAE
jgi:hypothetical protein